MKNKTLYMRAINIVILVLALLYYNQILGLNQQLVQANETITQLTSSAATTSESSGSTGAYKDGTYQGSAKGFGGTVTVEVTVESGYIVDIQVISAENEDAAYYNMAIDVLDQIVEKQTWEADAVSGATYTSNGIINAAKEALGKAGAE